MRHHVAAIPVDDILRPEGEWLLRSHQVRQRALREASKGPTPPRANMPFIPDDEPPYTIRQVQSTIALASPSVTTRRFGYVAALTCLVIVVVAGSAWAARNPSRLAAWLRTDSETAASPDSLAEPVHQPTQAQAADGVAPTVAPTAVLTPTATTAPDVPANVVELVATPTASSGAIAASTPGLVAELNATQAFDLQGYLQGLNRRDLAQLAVSASIQGTVLSLQGLVPSFAARQALIEAAQGVPGVTAVRDVDLLLRPPPTYVVQPGDTLWDIAYQLYGDVSKIPVLLDANRTLLPSPESLSVGMELKIPQIE